jgi:hypothetical protein
LECKIRVFQSNNSFQQASDHSTIIRLGKKSEEILKQTQVLESVLGVVNAMVWLEVNRE